MIFECRRHVARGWPGIAAATLMCSLAHADGFIVDRVYDPYVQPLETEIELRSVTQFGDDLANQQRHSIGIGRSLSDNWAVEVYAVGTKTERDGYDFDVYEFEATWQLTEQGEYAVDWGMVFEFDREFDDDIEEASATVVAARDFGRWTTLLNVGISYEWGEGVSNEAETDMHFQTRYRYKEFLEPGMELHVGQNSSSVGPAFSGALRTSPGRKLNWEAGVFFGLDEVSADYVVKLNLEYEF